MSTSIRIFDYFAEEDAFLPTPEYKRIADELGLTEWHPAVWIGRLFMLDNDYGEHWFDNWELREERGLTHDHLIVDPDRFQNGADGPCNTAEFCKRFWTDVLRSLHFDLELIIEKARQYNERGRKLLDDIPDIPANASNYVPDLEECILEVRRRYETN